MMRAEKRLSQVAEKKRHWKTEALSLVSKRNHKHTQHALERAYPCLAQWFRGGQRPPVPKIAVRAEGAQDRVSGKKNR